MKPGDLVWLKKGSGVYIPCLVGKRFKEYNYSNVHCKLLVDKYGQEDVYYATNEQFYRKIWVSRE